MRPSFPHSSVPSSTSTYDDNISSTHVDVEVLDGGGELVASADARVECRELAQRVGAVDRVAGDRGEDVAVLDDDRFRGVKVEVLHQNGARVIFEPPDALRYVVEVPGRRAPLRHVVHHR